MTKVLNICYYGNPSPNATFAKMEAIVKKLSRALEQQLDITSKTSFIQEGICCITFSHIPMRVFIYDDFIKERINPPNDLPNVHIDRDMLTREFNKILARMTTRLGFGKKLHARKTVAARVDKKIALEFQQEHHLQVPLPGKYRYGLFHEGELVSIALFSGGRKMNDRPADYRSFELIRFCHKQNILVIGGLSKLIKAFQQDFAAGDIMTYVDRDWSQDSALKSIGFKEISRMPPQGYILDKKERRTLCIQELKTILTDTASDGTSIKYNSGSTKMTLFLSEDIR